MGIKQSVVSSLIYCKKRFSKKLKNSQLKAKRLGKTADFAICPFFTIQMLLEYSFINIFLNRFLRWIRLEKTDRLIPILTCFEKMKKSLLLVVLSATKSRLRRSICILEKTALGKCCLDFKNTVVFTSCNGDFQNSWKSITLTVHT